MADTDRIGRGAFTRRGTLAAMALAAVAPALPALARSGPAPVALSDELAAIARAATGTSEPRRVGAAAAAGRNAHEVADALLRRLDPAGSGGDWRAALVAAGRRDIARGETLEVLGRTLMRTEADLLALGALLHQQDNLV